MCSKIHYTKSWWATNATSPIDAVAGRTCENNDCVENLISNESERTENKNEIQHKIADSQENGCTVECVWYVFCSHRSILTQEVLDKASLAALAHTYILYTELRLLDMAAYTYHSFYYFCLVTLKFPSITGVSMLKSLIPYSSSSNGWCWWL